MAYIEKRILAKGKVVYRVRIRQKGYPEVQQTFQTRKEAEKFSRRMEAEMNTGRYFGLENAKEKTFAELVDRYIEKELPKTPQSYGKQKMLISWWKQHLGRHYLCHITPGMIAVLRDQLLSEKTRRGHLRTGSTVRRYLSALSRAFEIAQKEWQWVRENPVKMIKKPKENKHRERYLEKEEIGKLLQECKQSKSPHLYSVVVFALATGARKGEILNLKWTDVSFEKSIATFRDTKNGDTRSVYLTESLLDCLRHEQGKRIVFSEYVFPRGDGNGPACIRTAWDKAVKNAGLKDICFHTLRHTAASHMAMSGTSILQIAKILGHKSTAITSKIYAHLSITSTASSLNRLEEEILGEFLSG